MSIEIGPAGILLDDRYLPFYSGTVHYWRHPVESWKTIVENVKKSGFDVITVDTPWGVHETGPSIFDFGSQRPAKNLDSFLRLCQECSLSVIIRPGPFHDGNIPCSGLPHWLVQIPTLSALTATGAPAVVNAMPYPHPIPSLAADRLYQEFGKYLRMLCPTILLPHLHPKGPIILFQGGGTQGFFGRTKAYNIDYSAGSLGLYHHFLSEKYASIEALNDSYGAKHLSFSEVAPPRGCPLATFENLRWLMDWAAFKEYLLAEHSRRIVALLRENGVTAPIYHVAESITPPVRHHASPGEEKSDFTGIRLHPSLDRFQRYVNEIRFACGTYPLAFASDFPQGSRCFSASLSSPAEQEFFILAALMFGISAFDFRMAAECDDWTGSPVTRTGGIRSEFADLHKKITGWLAAYEVPESRKACKVLLLANSGIERYRLAVSKSDLAHLDLLQIPKPLQESRGHFGFVTDPYPESLLHPAGNWISGVMRFLESNQVEFNLSDTDAPFSVLNQYKLVFLPLCDFIGEADFANLMDYAQRGGHLIFGPSQPSLNENFGPLPLSKVVFGQFLYRYVKMETPGTESMDRGKVTWLPDPAGLPELIGKELQNEVLIDNPQLRLTVREGSHTLIFLCNPTDQQQSTKLVSARPIRGIWNAPDTAMTGIFQTILQPVSIQVWEAVG